MERKDEREGRECSPIFYDPRTKKGGRKVLHLVSHDKRKLRGREKNGVERGDPVADFTSLKRGKGKRKCPPTLLSRKESGMKKREKRKGAAIFGRERKKKRRTPTTPILSPKEEGEGKKGKKKKKRSYCLSKPTQQMKRGKKKGKKRLGFNTSLQERGGKGRGGNDRKKRKKDLSLRVLARSSFVELRSKGLS